MMRDTVLVRTLLLLLLCCATVKALTSHQRRRAFVKSVASSILTTTVVAPLVEQQHNFLMPVANAAAVRAVGSGEVECRKAGNCLEKGEWDGAVGWEWGGKDRCDAMDPQCGPDGKLRESAIVGKDVPVVPIVGSDGGGEVRFTHAAAIQIEVGRGEIGTLKIGLYGNEAPARVEQLVSFLSSEGLSTRNSNKQSSSNTLGATQQPVSLSVGGTVTGIVPSTEIEFGVPSQANAYAKSRGKAKAGDSFQPQSRPPPITATTDDGFVRPHDCAGLVSVPEKGLGYGGSGFENDDECFEFAFVITDAAVPAFDESSNKSKRRVVGQILDTQSMAFLERLSNIPTKRGIRGVIPGQTSGPPLPKVAVREVEVTKVAAPRA